MSKSSGNVRKSRGGLDRVLDINSVKNGLYAAGVKDRKNNNSTFALGFVDDAQSVVDSVAKGDSFASKVAQSVQKYGYKMSEKQAYVIAKEAVETRNKALFERDNKTVRPLFQKSEPEFKMAPKSERFLDIKEAKKIVRKKTGMSAYDADKLVRANYSRILEEWKKNKGKRKDAIEYFKRLVE